MIFLQPLFSIFSSTKEDSSRTRFGWHEILTEINVHFARIPKNTGRSSDKTKLKRTRLAEKFVRNNTKGIHNSSNTL